jgi:peptide/nickel transport system substrate-binding protein
MLARDGASHAVGDLVFDGLLTYDKNQSQFEPRLARSWEVSSDGLTITFHLRDDVQWQDGQPFTARDIEFGYRTITDPKTLTAYAEDYRQITAFEVLDPHVFRVRYEQPYAPALGTWGNLLVLPRHVLEGKDINEAAEFARKPVGLGRYRLEAWETGRSISLRANADYYRDRPHIERTITRIIPDPQTQFLELQSGGIDQMDLTALQYSRQTLKPSFTANFRKYRYLTNSYTYLGYNLQNDLFKDVRVRRALTHAIDKEELVAVVLFGLGRPAKVPYKPGTRWYNENAEDLPYDPQTARALLAAAGWRDSDGDGVLDRDGNPFRFRILTNQGNESRLKTATIVQRRLADVGIDVEVRVIEWAAFLKEFVEKRNFEAVVLGWGLDLDPDQYIIWHSSKTGPSEFNFISYRNPEVDELLERGRRTFDPEERKRYYDRFQEILVEDQPYTFLYYAEALPVVHCRFLGIEPAPAGIGYNFERWYVPEALQKHRVLKD